MYAAKNGNETTGISFDDRNNKVATVRAEILNLKNIKFIKADLRKLDEVFKEKEIFDQIICFETIEHILNDKKLIKDLFVLLKFGGRLLLTTPYKNYINLYKDRISEVEDGGHMRKGYTFEELGKLTGEFGFKIELREYITGLISQQLINFLRIVGEVNPILGKICGVIFIPLRLIQFFDPLFTRLINYPFLSVAIVAKKIK